MDSGKVEGCTASFKFQHFDVIQDVANDHHYRNKKSHNYTIKYVMKEWENLRKNLPESIYVQAYETRIDLLRAVIIGSPATPYHDGLFFFDFYLPSDYPNKPPKVYYHTHGYHLNPNIYITGYVCLSLINTWIGHGNEKWRKGESTILQLLVSIQGLVLNEIPFFNEPGYGNHKNSLNPRWTRLAISYNQRVFLYSCMTMLKIMQKPPCGFNDFIVAHFKERSASIVATVKAYENGEVIAGQFQVHGSSSSLQVSSEFKSKLRRIGENLEKAFTKTHGSTIDSNKLVKDIGSKGENNDKISQKENRRPKDKDPLRNPQNPNRRSFWLF